MARTERELSDVQWARLAPLLPPQRPRMGRPPKDHRLIVEAIVWLDRTGDRQHRSERRQLDRTSRTDRTDRSPAQTQEREVVGGAR